MNAFAQQRLELENGLRRALVKGEFELHYQPKVDVTTGRISSTEALIRWRHPRARPGAAGRFHSARGRDRSHPADRRMGAARGLPAGAPMADQWHGAGARRHQHVGAAVQAEEPGEHRAVGAGKRQPRTDLPGNRTHRKRGHAQRRGVGRDSGAAEPARRAHFHRRLRHRLFEPELPAPLPARQAEDRPQLHQGRGRQPGRCGHRATPSSRWRTACG